MELCKVIDVDEPDLKVAFTLGNSKEGVVIPLTVVMNNKQKQMRNILDNASKLQQLPHKSEFVKCIIANDLTLRQREFKQKQKRREKER